MANTAGAPRPGDAEDWRTRAIRDPDTILDDREVMRALMAATDARIGETVVDMRGAALDRAERELDRLRRTHEAVIANAYDNLAGTNQVHRCVLAILACHDLPELLDALGTEVKQILRVASVRLAIEGTGTAAPPHPSVARLPPGGVAALLDVADDGCTPPVTLRAEAASHDLHRGGIRGEAVLSEALLKLDLGPGRAPALLVLGAADADAFRPGQGTDLLSFLGGCLGRTLRRMLTA